jgi:hypothetical protein
LTRISTISPCPSCAAIHGLFYDDHQELTPLIPKIVEIRKRTKDEDERHDATLVLLAYLDHSDYLDGGEKILAQSLDGLSDFYIANTDIGSLAIPVLEKYHQSDRASRVRGKTIMRISNNP